MLPLPRPIPLILLIDGVEYVIPQWLEVGQSFFMPCLNAEHAYKKVTAHYAPFKFKLVYRERIEADTLGIRVWRTG